MSKIEVAMKLLTNNGEKFFISKLFESEVIKIENVEKKRLKKVVTYTYQLNEKIANQIVNRFSLRFYSTILSAPIYEFAECEEMNLVSNKQKQVEKDNAILFDCVKSCELVYRAKKDNDSFDEKVEKISTLVKEKVKYTKELGFEFYENRCTDITPLSKDEINFVKEFTKENLNLLNRTFSGEGK